jgi:SAM-dependent methyltransferase
MRVGMEPASDGLRLSRRRSLKRLVGGAVGALPFAVESFDVVTSVDVLCHRLVDEEEALREMRRVLAPRGVLVLQVPAFDALRSEHDDAVWTNRRYRLGEVRRMLRRCGFEVESARYRIGLLFPLAALRRMLRRRPDPKAARSDVHPAGMVANAFLGAILRGEEALGSVGLRLPFGLSVFCVARKPKLDSLQ